MSPVVSLANFPGLRRLVVKAVIEDAHDGVGRLSGRGAARARAWKRGRGVRRSAAKVRCASCCMSSIMGQRNKLMWLPPPCRCVRGNLVDGTAHRHVGTTTYLRPAGLWRSLAWAVLDSVPRSGNAWQPRQPKQPPDLLMRHPLKGQGCSPAHPTLRPSDQQGQGLPRLHQCHLLHVRWLCMRLRQSMRLGFRRLSHRWLSFHLFHLAATTLYFAIDTCRLVAHLHGFCAHPLGCTVP